VTVQARVLWELSFRGERVINAVLFQRELQYQTGCSKGRTSSLNNFDALIFILINLMGILRNQQINM